ncbi:hypothetical protein BYT27DRAFT_7195388 [Phlegmacium glaucopus]|nr:hypothetical protein BYT27DRAFT_7195388 [Phlegmacium glaucopus]
MAVFWTSQTPHGTDTGDELTNRQYLGSENRHVTSQANLIKLPSSLSSSASSSGFFGLGTGSRVNHRGFFLPLL